MAKSSGTSSKKRSLLQITVKELIDDYIYLIDLDAEYQREKIWTTKQQELLIDSITQDIDIPKIYLVETPDKKEQFKYECIDGKQRMSSLLRFFKPDEGDESPLTFYTAGEKYTYSELKKEYPTLARKIENYELTLSVYKSIDEELLHEIFRRLQLGIRLNSGEMLKTRMGTIRDFIYKEIGNDGFFFRKTNLSEKRFSRPFTLAQICLNSFSRAENNGEFIRARLNDIEDFFESKQNLSKNDPNLVRIRAVLKLMDSGLTTVAPTISSRAIAVTAYLFVEELYENELQDQVPLFSQFYAKLLNTIKQDMELLTKFEKPTNTLVLDEFQKYILQASVEPYSLKRRHNFLTKAFAYYKAPKTKGTIIGS